MKRVLRVIGAVVAGYVTMAVIVIVGVGLAAHLLVSPEDGRVGADYLSANIVVSLLAAIAGGFVAGRIALVNHALAAGVLAALILLLGVAMEWGNGQPGWYALLTPLIGAAGVLLGGYAQSRLTTQSH